MDSTLTVRAGQPLSLEELREFLKNAGYAFEARVEGPCEASIQGAIVDVFPAGGCGIRGKAASDSDGKRPPNPKQSGQ
jgi:transcription-repair coupling factor (superfamily II helicase)